MRKGLISLLLLVAAVLGGCGLVSFARTTVRGSVVDIQGEPIPGVVVSLAETDRQCLSDALGQYKLPAQPGPATLHFMKTGFTTGALSLGVLDSGDVFARPVSLWCLPQNAGLFLFEDYQYRRTAVLIPRPYVDKEGRVLYGVAKLTGVEETLLQQPLLLCYRMPAHDVKLCRLESVKAAAPESPSVMTDVWTEAKQLPLAMAPVDEPDRLLWEVRLMNPLEPGVYALHWGALDGHTSTDERMYAFVVGEPGEEAEPAETSEADEKEPVEVGKQDAE